MAISNIQNQYFHSRWRGMNFKEVHLSLIAFLDLVSFSGLTVDCSSILSCAVMFYYPKDLILLPSVSFRWTELHTSKTFWFPSWQSNWQPQLVTMSLLHHENRNQQVWQMAGNVSEKWWRSSGEEHEHTLETTKAVSSWADICTTHTWRTSARLCAQKHSWPK